MNRRRMFITLLPLLLVNSVAIIAQIEFWHAHLPWPFMAAVVFALALESVAIFLAYNATLASLANDSAAGLRLAAYGMGIVIGLLNASHYLTATGNITAAAIGVGLMSAISPWLWAVHTRRTQRDALLKNGLVEPHALRIGTVRWLWHPEKSYRVMSQAVWSGERVPSRAIIEWEDSVREAEQTVSEPVKALPVSNTTGGTNGLSSLSKAGAIRYAVQNSGKTTAADIADWLATHGVGEVTPEYVSQVRSRSA